MQKDKKGDDSSSSSDDDFQMEDESPKEQVVEFFSPNHYLFLVGQELGLDKDTDFDINQEISPELYMKVNHINRRELRTYILSIRANQQVP